MCVWAPSAPALPTYVGRVYLISAALFFVPLPRFFQSLLVDFGKALEAVNGSTLFTMSGAASLVRVDYFQARGGGRQFSLP